jgi:hypothetical protein
LARPAPSSGAGRTTACPGKLLAASGPSSSRQTTTLPAGGSV